MHTTRTHHHQPADQAAGEEKEWQACGSETRTFLREETLLETAELFRCVLCEEVKDEVVYTTGDRIGGSKTEKVIVCEECLDRVDEMEDTTEYSPEDFCKYCKRPGIYCICP